MPNAVLREYFELCSNAGKWGDDDERGTLNYITPQRVIDAVGTVRDGTVVSLAHDLPTIVDIHGRAAATLKVMHQGAASTGTGDTMTIRAHGFEITHVDALGHAFFEGNAYNGRIPSQVVADDGLKSLSVMAMANGIVTRGVLVDVAAARGVTSLVAGDGISVADLLEAERRSGIVVRDGDAIFIRSGIGQDPRWSDHERIEGRPGLLAEVVPWLHERQIAVYSGDCFERMPSAGSDDGLPLHQIGISAMGLCLLDNANVEPLHLICEQLQRWEFLVLIAPLRIPGGTGSAVNPIAVF